MFNKVLFGGLIGSWFSFLQFLVSPLIGAVSDVYGRRSTMLVCLCGVSLSYLVWLQSKESFLLFVVSRTIGGLSKGNVSLSTAVVADTSTENKRGKGMAMIGIAFSIGFIVGPLLGAMFAAHSRARGVTTSETFFYLPALFALCLSLLNIIFVAVFFDESLPAEHRVRNFYNWLNHSFVVVLFIHSLPFSYSHLNALSNWTILLNLLLIRFQAKSLGSGLRRALDFVNPHSLLTFRSVGNISEKGLFWWLSI